MPIFFFIVREQSAAVVENLGKFSRVCFSGLHFKLPWESVAGRLTLRIQEMQVNVETKTSDDVFVRALIAVQYYVMPERVREAYYRLSNPHMQIESYVFDVVRSTVPRMKLDEVFEEKETIATAVKEGLSETMTQYGYAIVRALVNDIDPDARVKAAMNEINAAQRMRKAAEERGEAERILKVKQAQGEAESKILQGKGIAGQRRAIVDGLRESVEEFQKGVPGATSSDVMQLVLMTQYFDTLKDIGIASRATTILMPHTPGALTDISDQVRQAIMTGNVVTDEHRMATAQANREAEKHPRHQGNDPALPGASTTIETPPIQSPALNPTEFGHPEPPRPPQYPRTQPPGR